MGHNIGKSICYLFFGLGLLCIPFPYDFFSPQQLISSFLFEDIVRKLQRFFNYSSDVQPLISSDTSGMYLLLLILFGFAVLLSVVLRLFKFWEKKQSQVFASIHLVAVYYLSLQLFIYGCDKLFKAQFYLPEPNTLYTPLGQISKDLLFWSMMGSAYSYNIFMGLLELIPAILLWFRSTRIIGLLIAFGVLLNIVFINIGFDISVKLYSIFLFSLCFFLLYPNLKDLFSFFVQKKKTFLSTPHKLQIKNTSIFKLMFKCLAIGLIIAEGLFPYVPNGIFNDDLAPRPFLHGAFQVEKIMLGDSLIARPDWKIKRVFIHRKGYLILENPEAQMQDYKLTIDTAKQELILFDYDENVLKADYNYQKYQGLLEIYFPSEDQTYYIKSRALKWRELPLIQDDFHWMIEEVE